LRIVVILYLDTSSLIKLYFREEGSEAIRSLIQQARTLTSSAVAYVETRSGLVRGWRGHRLTDLEYSAAQDAFERDWTRYFVEDATLSLVREAAVLAERYFLRGLDAIHLASALTLQRELRDAVTFSSADNRLMSAAVAEGLLQP
jgi:predicted nucleic acid-binding protein